jgi:phosphoglycerate kinase
LGRPEGRPDQRFTLAPIAARLEQLLGQPIGFAADVVGVEANGMAKALAPGGVGVIENLRFHSEETSKDPGARLEFAKRWAALGEMYVNDAFGVVHRDQASVVEIAQLLPAWAGDLMVREVSILQQLVESAQRPYTVVLGGAKVSDKLAVIEHLLPRIDRLLIGGGMAFTMLSERGHSIGRSLFEPDAVPAVKEIFARAAELGVQIELPADIVVAAAFAADAETATVAADAIQGSRFGDAAIGMDIGIETGKRFARLIAGSKTVFWNGPMGVFEF